MGLVENPTRFAVFTKIQFFWNKQSPGNYKHLIKFRSSKKVNFDNFCQCFHCFYGGEDFHSLILPFLMTSKSFLYLQKNVAGIVIGIALNVYINLGRIEIFTGLSLPIFEHGMSSFI